MTCQFSDVRNAFDFISLGQPRENQAYLNRETGVIFWQGDHSYLSDTLPDAIGDPDRYIAIPHKTDLGLGKATCPSVYSRVSAGAA